MLTLVAIYFFVILSISLLFVICCFRPLVQDSDITGGDSDTIVLERCNAELQVSLDSEAVVDAMDAEQTWPTPDELHAAEGLLI